MGVAAGMLWFFRRRGSCHGEAGDVNHSLDVFAPLVDGFDHVAGADVVYLIEFRSAQRFGAAGAMNDVSRIVHRLAQARQVVDGAEANLDLRQMLLDKSPVARGS